MELIIIYFILSLINVIVSTVKSVMTVRGSTSQAVFINTLSYTIGIVVIKNVSEVSYVVAIIVTILTNLGGVWIGKVISNKLQKEDYWKFTTVCKNLEVSENLIELLRKTELDFTVINIEKRDSISKSIDVFSESKSDSKIIEDIFKELNVNFCAVRLVRKVDKI